MKGRQWLGLIVLAFVVLAVLVSRAGAAGPPAAPEGWRVVDHGDGSASLQWLQPEGVTQSIALRTRAGDTVEIVRRSDLAPGLVDLVVEYQPGDCFALTLFSTSAPPASYTTTIAQSACTGAEAGRAYLPVVLAP